VFDLDAYLERIGLRGRPGIVELHRAHVSSIPFENLDPHCGVPVSLELEALQDKLVMRRRGGYCFEQNFLLGSALEALGAEVDLLLARVRTGARGTGPRPRSHLVLRVLINGDVWHADVGFGAGTLTEPIPFGPSGVHEQSGWRFRVVAQGPELVLQGAEGDGWTDMYGFVPEQVPFVDLETSNWFTSTHPRSPFVTGLAVARQRRDGTRVSVSDWDSLALVEHSPAARDVRPVTRDEVPRLLETHFDLPGFTVDGDGRIVPESHGVARTR
jgi:N-hydroxyarylamine O-acetyltransferase